MTAHESNYYTPMKRLYFLIAALGMAGALSAQTPVNDDCSGLIDLGTAPICTPAVFTNVGATSSNIGNDNNPTCFNSGTAQRDVWFMFTCPDTLFDFRITLTGVGNSIENPEFAVYRGDCEVDGLAELLCAKAEIGETSLFLDVTGLTPGLQYFIRVSDYSQTATPNSGEFTLCVDKIPPIVTIDQGSSSLCEGTLYDSGGPDNDYGSDEDFTFVICPNQPSACITFTLQYYNIDGGNLGGFGDALAFYDGNSTNGNLITQINGGNFTDPVGGGGVCFQVQATSGCLTVQFQSDGTTEFEGWQGHWECSSQACPQQEELSVNTNITAQDIDDAISTPLTTVTITDINCPQGAYGTFSFPTDNNGLGLEKGLVLTSGAAELVIGPNSFTGIGADNGGEGDPDLDYLSQQQGNGTPSFNACIVELDVFAGTDELVFEYVFGSDEYPEFVNSNFNDIFAFLISGPGIVGDPGLGGAQNIAVLPFTTTPVQINSVNNQQNWQYYRNNQGDQTLAQVLEYDGLTSDTLGVKKSLTSRQKVIPCNTYHLKLAVADRGDGILDSGVFVSEIKAGTPDLTVEFTTGIDYLTESCIVGAQDFIKFNIPKPLDQPSSYTVTIGGTATQGTDYTLVIPNIITFQPGETEISFPISPISDILPEGTETITIQLSNDFGCGVVILKTLVIEIKEKAEVNVIGGDTLFVCTGATLQLQAKGAVEYFWAPPGAVSNPFIANPTTTPTQDFWLEVTGTVGVCVDVDSAFIKIVAPVMDVSALTPTNICQGGSVQLQATNNVNNTGLVWTPAVGLDDQNSATPIATPPFTVTYTATVNIAGCSASDQVTVNVDTLFFPQLNNDTTVCQNYPVQLGTVLSSTTEYDWTPATGLDNPGSSGPIALPDATTTYTLTATSANGYCSQTESVTVNIIPANVDVQGAEYRELCLGESVALTAQSSPAGAQQVQWSPSFYLSNTSGPNTVATPDESITVIATYVVNGCTVRDSVRLRVDSLPDQSLKRVEDKMIYCPGDTVYLISPTYEPANFPDIEIEWLPFGGQETPVDLWNMVITATTTHIFQRVITNRGCTDTSEIEVPVGVPPTLTIDATPKIICPGQTAQINVLVDPPGTKLEWQDMPPTLSCGDCPDPVASPITTTTYSITTPDADCPGGASITIEVTPPPALNLPLNPVFCAGGPGILLNTIAEPGVTYTWTPATGLDDPTSATPIATPLVATTYTVLAVGPACSSQGTVSVGVGTTPVLTVDASPLIICAGETAQINVTVNPAGTVLQWTGAPSSLSCSNCASPVASPLTTTTYTVTTPQADCPVNASVTIDVLPVPALNLTANPVICKDGTGVQLNDLTEPDVTYTWTPAAGLDDPFSPTPFATPSATTVYTVLAAGLNCSTQGMVTVTVADATINAGADQTICLTTSTTLTATVTGTQGNITWQPGNQAGPTYTVDPTENTVYTAQLVYGNNCFAQDSVLITVIPTVVLSAISTEPAAGDSICIGLPITMQVTVDPPDASLVWTQDDTVLPGLTSDSVTFSPQVAEGSARFAVIATNSGGCTAQQTVSFDFKRCVAVPNAFTPGNDDVNDTFGPLLFGSNTQVTTFQVFNRWGTKVFESTPDKPRWDGQQDGKDAPSDIYAYYIVLRYADGQEETLKGDVALLR